MDKIYTYVGSISTFRVFKMAHGRYAINISEDTPPIFFDSFDAMKKAFVFWDWDNEYREAETFTLVASEVIVDADDNVHLIDAQGSE